jgi:hypothetical protein
MIRRASKLNGLDDSAKLVADEQAHITGLAALPRRGQQHDSEASCYGLHNHPVLIHYANRYFILQFANEIMAKVKVEY